MTNQPSEDQGIPAHLTERTYLQPVIQAWKYYLNDQGRSPYTVKAFVADLNLLDGFLAPDKTIGDISLTDLEKFTEWLQNERGVPCSPKKPIPPDHIRKKFLPLAAKQRCDPCGPR